MSPTQYAWEALSNTMRLYAESSARFHYLMQVDQEEAVANLDRAFEAKLESFHRLYDLTKSVPGFGYFDHADTSLMIVLRNALHHRDHTLFTSWNRMMILDGGVSGKAGAAYLIGEYERQSERTSRYPLPLQDFYQRLSHSSIRKPDTLRKLWNDNLAFEQIADHAKREGYPTNQVYVDVLPVFCSALKRVTSWMQTSEVAPVGFDSATYVAHFSRSLELDLRVPAFKVVRIPSFLADIQAPDN
ncbi:MULTISPECIES: hypothetical protein [Pseudomonadaceae]|uniref:Uncharacterized protein n=1 Tax=Ectopseudomonas oleovorans TaxID=301 RepID=A0AB35L7Q1_ECTOL|nr:MULTISPECIES: hypothetical protein [Pseudomonas]MCR1828776.1 hypothetical protein [Pseudomonas oleovorans]MDH0569594.1 hypothetical protein [Pseudomonas oleovorans]MDH2201030.1 hypothetical protein [Pseudomonas oleovorans]